MRVNQAPSMLPLCTPQPHIPATGVSQTIIKQDQEKCETRGYCLRAKLGLHELKG